MSPETINLLVNAGAGLLGAIVGAGATLVGQLMQRRGARTNEIERESREVARRELEAKVERQRQAAESCDELLFRLAGLARQLAWPRDRQVDFPKRAAPLLAEVSSHSVFLPEALRERVDEAAMIIADSSALAPDPESDAPVTFHYRTMWSIAETTHRDAHLALAAWLQDEPLPHRSQAMQENVAAHKDYADFMDDLYSDRDDDWYSDAKQSFFADHPDLRPANEQSSG